MLFDINIDSEYSAKICEGNSYVCYSHSQIKPDRRLTFTEKLVDSIARVDLSSTDKLTISSENAAPLYEKSNPLKISSPISNYPLLSNQFSRVQQLTDDYVYELLKTNPDFNEGNSGLEKLASNNHATAPISITVNDVTVNEDAGFAQLEINLSKAPGEAIVEFRYFAIDETASIDEDYTFTPELVTLTGSKTSIQIPISIIDDFDQEDEETFGVEVSNVFGAILLRASGTVTIVDNDGETDSSNEIDALESTSTNELSISDIIIEEQHEEAIIKFSLSQPPGQNPVEFNYSTVEATALEGEDYEAGSGYVSFSGNETEKFIIISLINDLIVEQAESFRVEVSDLSGASLSNPSAIITIRDDDTESSKIMLTVDAVTVDESAGVAVIKFSLSNPPGQGEVEFNFSTMNGSAVDGIDFSGESGFRAMTGNETQSFVSIPIFDDDESEDMETFDVEITNLLGAEIINPVITYSILDNDQITNMLTVSDVTEIENSDSVVFKFSLQQAPGGNTVEFNFTTVDGSAIEGQDYTGVSGFRSMQGPTKEMYLSIPIVNDSISESEEAFTLSITNVQGANYGGAAVTATIEDDD